MDATPSLPAQPPMPMSPMSAVAATSSRAMPRPHQLSSRALLGDQPEVEILHGDQVYRLRRTALGKLILTK